MREIWKNAAIAKLARKLAPTDTEAQLASGTGELFPSPLLTEEFFRVKLESGAKFEWCLCLSRVGDILTLTRAEEGTTAQTWNVGSKASNKASSQTLADLRDRPVATWLHGSGAPAAELGADGQFYVDVESSNFYTKADGEWTLEGPLGTPGPPGADGAEGSEGPPGATGPQGPDGAPGATGATGAPGPSNIIHTTTGPTDLTVGAIADGEYLKRAGATVVGGMPAGGGGGSATVWRNGSGAPSNGLGSDGDYYLNDSNGDVYFKAGGAYSVVANIEGPAGSTGAQGPTGATGPEGPQGLQGATGSQGPAGSTGPQGDPGATGATGAAGPSNLIHTTTGPTDLIVGAVADGEYLRRAGSTIVGGTPSGGAAAMAGIVRRTADFSVPNGSGTYTPVQWQTESKDYGGMVDLAGQNTRITLPNGEDGLFLVTGAGRYAPNATGYRALGLRKNGTTFFDYSSQGNRGGSDPVMIELVRTAYLVGGDWVELIAEQNSGAPLNLQASFDYQLELAVTRLIKV